MDRYVPSKLCSDNKKFRHCFADLNVFASEVRDVSRRQERRNPIAEGAAGEWGTGAINISAPWGESELSFEKLRQSSGDNEEFDFAVKLT